LTGTNKAKTEKKNMGGEERTIPSTTGEPRIAEKRGN